MSDIHQEPDCNNTRGCENPDPHKHGLACDETCWQCAGKCHQDCPAHYDLWEHKTPDVFDAEGRSFEAIMWDGRALTWLWVQQFFTRDVTDLHMTFLGDAIRFREHDGDLVMIEKGDYLIVNQFRPLPTMMVGGVFDGWFKKAVA